jgi:uncharacterized protein
VTRSSQNTPPSPPFGLGLGVARPLELGLGAAWLVGVAAALQLLDRLPLASLAVAILGAVVVDLAATRAGVRWDPDEAAPDRTSRAARRMGFGALAALATGAIVLVVSYALGWVHGTGEPIRPSLAVLLAVVRAAAIAVRDEVLFRGIPLLAASRAGVGALPARIFAALAGGAAIAMMPGAGPASVALAVGSGYLTASLWQREGGAWAPIGARAAWLLLFGSLLHGGMLDVDWHVGEIAIGNTSSGPPAWLAAVCLVAAGVVVMKMPKRGEGAKA